jgi:hypothetical protein
MGAGLKGVQVAFDGGLGPADLGGDQGQLGLVLVAQPLGRAALAAVALPGEADLVGVTVA